jgi:peptidoglycan/LPS O-acetylase OafA/YrhL
MFFRQREPTNSEMAANDSAESFRPDVEGLRGVAVLIVVGCHCGISWCRGGFVGVDVFFALSGYLITSLLVAEYRATSRIELRNFYARRARRLLPAGVLVLAVTSFFALAFLTPQEMTFAGRAARWAGLYVSNVFFDHSASDYFAPDVEGNPLLHTWSLGLEEQFYLLWPMLILVAHRGPHRTQRLVGILSAAIVLSFACSVYATNLAPTFAFYELPARGWEFAAGGLLALLPVSKIPGSSGWAVGFGLIGLAVILGACVVVKGGAGFPGWIALFPVAGTLAILLAGAKAPRRGTAILLSAAPLQFVGARSYAWYLWHWPFLVFAGILVPGITLSGRLLAAAASLFAASLTFRFVERPIRWNRRLSSQSGLSLRLAGIATLLIVGASSALALYGQQELAIDSIFRSIGAASADISDISIKDCVSQGASLKVNKCGFGVSDTQRTVVLFGDSHAVQWFNAFRTAAHMESWRLITVMKLGCAASDINPHRLSVAKNECRDWRNRAIDEIVAMRPSAVVMASYTGATIRGFRAEEPMSTDELRLGTRRTLERLWHAGISTVLLRDTPLPPFDIPQCVARYTLQNATSACDFDASAALDEKAFSSERAAAEGLTNIYFLDMTDLICPGSSCPAKQHGLIVYRDDNHLTGSFAESLAPTLRTRLFQLLRNAS